MSNLVVTGFTAFVYFAVFNCFIALFMLFSLPFISVYCSFCDFLCFYLFLHFYFISLVLFPLFLVFCLPLLLSRICIQTFETSDNLPWQCNMIWSKFKFKDLYWLESLIIKFTTMLYIQLIIWIWKIIGAVAGSMYFLIYLYCKTIKGWLRQEISSYRIF